MIELFNKSIYTYRYPACKSAVISLNFNILITFITEFFRKGDYYEREF